MNFDGFCGFRTNSQDYTAYLLEHEYLLMDGVRFVVLKVEEMLIEKIYLINQYKFES